MRKWILIVGIGFVVVCLGGVVVLYSFAPRLKGIARQRAQIYLQAHFKSSVQFSGFDIAFYPRLHVTVSGLVLRFAGRTDLPPLIEIRQASFDVGIRGLLAKQHKIRRLRLEGLQIRIPPRTPGSTPLIHGTSQSLARKYPILIDELDADGALLVLLRKPSDAGKPPIEFDIHRLVVYHFNFDSPAAFDAFLTNPKPQGEIHCVGQFGPWQADEPSETPVYSKFTFANADMATLKGLSGTLSSVGRFGGPLDYLNVEGVTDIPDFALRTSARSMPLHTDFSAIVDGTNGDVVLKNVTAKLGHSTIVTHGEVVDVNPLVKGRTIVLDATSEDAHVEDLLMLAAKTDKPVMRGTAWLTAKILIPESNEDLVDRLILDSQFGVGKIHFTNPNVQGKVDALSRKGQGHPNEDLSNAVSDLSGKSKVRKATVSFSDLRFRVEGASINLAGDYDMDSGRLNFRGKLRLEAKLSQTMTGVKSLFLKPLNPFFKGKNAGTELPIKITGTEDHPSFGLDFHDKTNTK